MPSRFAHGFIGLERENIVYYTCTNYWSKKNEVGLAWNDKDLNIKWPTKNPTVSLKDRKNLKLKEFVKKYIKKRS